MGVRAIFQLATPYTEDEVFDLGYEQAVDVVVLTHLDHPVQQLRRYDHDNWTITPASYAATIAAPTGFTATTADVNTGTGYLPIAHAYTVTAIDAATGQESLEAGGDSALSDLTFKGNQVNLAWDAVPGAESYNVYKFYGGGYYFIGNTASLTFADENILPDTSLSFPLARNPFSSTGNYPATVTFWQQRSMYGRTLLKPNGVFGSQSANLFNMNVSRPIQVTDAVAFAVSGRRVNAVMHLVPLKDLIVLTTDLIFTVNGNTNGQGFSPLNIDITPEGYRGASRVRPIVIDEIGFFACAKGGTMRTLNYTFEKDGYSGNDITVFAPHFFENVSIVDMAWAEFPASAISAIMSDGDIRLLTWQSEQDVWGWSKMTSPTGFFESCCSVTENGEDVVYYVVKRGAKRFVEYTASTRWVDVDDCVYLDSSRRYVGAPANHFTGMTHLVGIVDTITVLADGAVFEDVPLAMDGSFDLDVDASKVTAGIGYEAWARTLELAGAAQSYKGEPQTLAGCNVMVKRTRGIEIGLGKNLPSGQFEPVTSDDEIAGIIDEVKTRTDELFGEPTRLVSGNLNVDLEAGDWTSASVVVRQRYPLPMTVLGITPDYVVSD